MQTSFFKYILVLYMKLSHLTVILIFYVLPLTLQILLTANNICFSAVFPYVKIDLTLKSFARCNAHYLRHMSLAKARDTATLQGRARHPPAGKGMAEGK